MVRVGIITMYHDSRNYGGLLQAYALCKYLNTDEHCQAEQISFNAKDRSLDEKTSGFRSIRTAEKLKMVFRFLNKHITKMITRLTIGRSVDRRNASVKKFRDSIPHSKTVYNNQDIKHTLQDYDLFITGSDRIWKPGNIDSPYFLNFVKDKAKASYAASLAANRLTKDQEQQIKSMLSDFDLVSVREKDAVDIVSPLTDKSVHWVVDPTFLLSREKWDQVASSLTLPEPYIFCYFLGSDSKNRRLAKAFAKQKHLKIATIPFARDVFSISDAS